MTDLDILLRDYAAFEEKVRSAMTGKCAAHCRVCTRICCREELCRETIESPFLCLLRQKFPPRAAYSSQKGWLTPTGCALSSGRPPVCYHFLCSDILASQPAPIACYLLEVLAALINHIGKNALGGRHLVEIMNPDDLYRVKLSRFKKRLAETRSAFNMIVSYFDYGHLDARGIAELSRIRPLPSDQRTSNMMAAIFT
jgi:hypothetical protein